jgi:hypothetical protein
MERREQERARPISREDPTGPIPAMGRGREADDQDPRVRIAEARDRTSPVLLVGVPRDLLARDVLAPRDQTRALPAHHDLGRHQVERATADGSGHGSMLRRPR